MTKSRATQKTRTLPKYVDSPKSISLSSASGLSDSNTQFSSCARVGVIDDLARDRSAGHRARRVYFTVKTDLGLCCKSSCYKTTTTSASDAYYSVATLYHLRASGFVTLRSLWQSPCV